MKTFESDSNERKTCPVTTSKELNGDDKLTPYQRLIYLGHNFWRNLLPCSTRLSSETFRSRRLERTSRTASPNRVLTEAFLVKMLPNLLPGGPIKVLDIGCGPGHMSELLAQAGFSGTYTGVDIEDRFANGPHMSASFDRTFVLGDAHDLPEPQAFDLIMSSSALEHIKNDCGLIQKLNRITSPDGIQVHLVPGAWSLPLYLWHGWRQYTLCNLSTRVHPEQTQIYRMGGISSFLLHFIFITISELILQIPFRKWFPGVYGQLLDMTIFMDHFLPIGAPFLAVCQRSHKIDI